MSDIKSLREISNDPFGKLLTSLSKKFSEFLARDQAENVENPEDIYSDGQDVESALKYHNFVMSKKFNLTTTYYSSADPDYDKLRVWIIGRNLGTNMRDYSGYGRIITIMGDPILTDGTPFDWGLADATSNMKSIAMRLNRPTSTLVNTEFIKVTHDTLIRVSEALSSGISFFIRFRLFDLADQDGWSKTLFEKLDNSTPTDAIRVLVDPNGRIIVRLKNSNVNYAWQTATGTIAPNIVYDVWITYNKTGNVFKVYVNNVDKTLSSATPNDSWHGDFTNYDLAIFTRGGSSTNGFVYGDFFEFRLYREKIISTAQVGYHWTNKITIANIPFGQVAVTNYFCSVA